MAKTPLQNPEIARLNAVIDGEQRRINDTYFQIGKQYAEAHKDDDAPEFADKIEIIKKAHKEIEDCKKQILVLNGIIVCPKCGGQVSIESAFCNLCGSPLPKKEILGYDVCRNCRAKLQPGVKFCTTCGTPVEQKSDAPVKKVCPRCGFESADPEAKFCNNCGIKLVDKPAQAAEQPVPAQPAPAQQPVQPTGNLAEDAKNFEFPKEFTESVAPETPEAPKDNVRRCPNCGNEVTNPDVRFCVECGTPLN